VVIAKPSILESECRLVLIDEPWLMSMYDFPDGNCVESSEWQSWRVSATAL
jgi:hypothetical protein